METPAIPEIIKTALDFEEKGRAFYTQQAQTVKDVLSRKLFATLAEDEVRHAQRIREIYAGLNTPQSWPKDLGPHRNLQADFKAFFVAHQRELKPGSTQLQGYEFALQMERRSVELYRQAVTQSRNDRERAFFSALAEEEKNHLEAIQNVHYFLTQPGDWYEQDESQRWNWMNL
jgi:rubrerythrin